MCKTTSGTVMLRLGLTQGQSLSWDSFMHMQTGCGSKKKWSNFKNP